MARFLVLDIATSPLENVKDFVTKEGLSAPDNYVKPDAIERYINKEYQKRLEKAALDPDTCRITAIGWSAKDTRQDVRLCRTEVEESNVLTDVVMDLDRFNRDHSSDGAYSICTFNGFKFDLPVLMRRCAYLGLPVPDINLDRYRSPHVDLYDRLTFKGAVTGHSLGWYVKRHGWTDLVKPLSGAEEAQVPVTGRWDELALSVKHDLTATYRLAQWLGVLPKADTRPEPIL